jgi:RHS repeat-associated protein
MFAERFAGLGGGGARWTNYLIAGGRLIGVHVQKADETTATRYFHTDHLGSISVITDEAGVVVERLSYDAWGKRRHPDGSPDPAGAITSETNRGFTGHEQLDSVGLVHMNGRVYDPLLGRFGTPDPMTEAPFSTQGWNRYSYVGNSPVNFTDPSGYCFMGCFWQPAFQAIGRFFAQNWRAILQVAVTATCHAVTQGAGGPACAALGSFVAGVTSGNLGQALRGAAIAFATAVAFDVVGTATLGPGHPIPEFLPPAHLANMAGHALVGCASAVVQGGRCGPGALAAAAGSLAGPIVGKVFQNPRTNPADLFGGTFASAIVGGLASVAGGGNFANGAVTSAFGYLFNALGRNPEERNTDRLLYRDPRTLLPECLISGGCAIIPTPIIIDIPKDIVPPDYVPVDPKMFKLDPTAPEQPGNPFAPKQPQPDPTPQPPKDDLVPKKS